MGLRAGILIVTTILSFPLLAQKAGNDTIPYGTIPAKSADNFTWETTADTAITLVVNELLAQNSQLIFDNYGDDDDWFEIYNYGDDPVLLNKVWFTDDPSVPLHWKIDTTAPVYLYPGEYFLVWADDEPGEGYNHANFKISGEGEYLGIFTSDLQMIDEVVFQEQTPNISYGRGPDAGLNWMFFDPPSPGRKNAESGGGMVLPAPASSKAGGLYDVPFSVQLSSPVTGAEIRYTLDATDPGIKSTLYDQPIEVDKTTVLKARLFREGDLKGPMLTCTYFINAGTYDNPVVSIVATPEDLYGDHGLIKLNSGNLEIPGHFEYIDGQVLLFSSGTGIQLHSVSSGRPTSMRFHARSRYGNDWFGYPFFGDQAPFHFKRLILRNSGNDNVNKSNLTTHFRDLLIQEIARKSFTDPLTSAGKPVNVFLNGQYFGIFNLRERIDQFYIETHMGVTDNYDLLERSFGFSGNKNPIVGSFDKWEALMSFADTVGNLAEHEDFNFVAAQVDLENFTNYWMTEVFAGNYDWLSNNVKCWKHEQSQWQWIFWDLDHGLGLQFNDYGNVSWNTLKWSLTTSDRAWPDGYNNRLIRNLVRNEQYRYRFITHFATLLNTSFAYTSTKPVYDSVRTRYENDMVYHTNRWNKDIDSWRSACDTLQSYLERRPAYLFRHMQDFFGLNEAVDVRMEVLPEGAGKIIWAGDRVPSPVLEGKYFPDMKYKIGAEPIPGYHLSHWTLNGDSTSLDSVAFSEPVEIRAYFVQNDQQLPIQITELYYNNRHYYDCGDWIEFLYYGFQPLDLSGAELMDNQNRVLYTFPEGSSVSSGTYFVIAENLQSFSGTFPDSVQVFGNLTGPFTEQLNFRLVLKDGSVAGPVDFMNTAGWPDLPAEGFSLELKLPVYNPETGASWKMSHNRFGSPGLSNSSYYDFHHPAGKDSVLSNREPARIRFSTSTDYFNDQDGHELAGIRIVSLEGPGKFYQSGNQVTGSSVLPPEDLYFEPELPYSRSSRLVYRLIDQSGESSDACTLEFLSDTKAWERMQSGWKLYPNPATDHFIFETDVAFGYPSEFVLLDITGKQVLHQHVSAGDRKIVVSLSGLESGIYIYKLQAPGRRMYGKVEVIR